MGDDARPSECFVIPAPTGLRIAYDNAKTPPAYAKALQTAFSEIGCAPPGVEVPEAAE